MPTFRNYNEFEKFFNSKLQKAMELTRDEVFEVVSSKISDYYNEDVFATPPTDVPDYYDYGFCELNCFTRKYIKLLIPSECDCIWKWGLCRYKLI